MLCVTSFGPKGWEEYAGAMLAGWAQHSKDLKLLAFYHDCEIPADAPKSPLIEYRNLTGLQERQEFLARFGKFNGATPQGYNYRMDVTKFCNKVFAIAAAAQEEQDTLVWFDADTLLRMDISEQDIRLIHPPEADISYLGRSAIDYAETSYIAFNMKSQRTRAFLSDFWGQYMNGEVMGYREWHDGFVFERLLRLHSGHGLKTFNVTPYAEGLDAFHQSPLGVFMRHFKGPMAKGGRVPIKVIPQNCVPAKQIQTQLTVNVQQMDKYISFCKPHAGAALMVSAGPSLDIEEVKRVMAQIKKEGREPYIFCIKHSLPALMEAGIVPFACILLDPRSIEGVSTHGKVRKQLLDKISPNTVFLTASMTDPSVIEHLKSKGANIVGWHAFTGANKDPLPPGHFYITGGTCAGVRGIGIAHALGFRDFHLFGYDSCWPENLDPEAKDETGRPKYMDVAWGDGPKRWTTGELLAQAQDVEELMKTPGKDFLIKIYGEGLVQDMAKTMPQRVIEDSFPNWLRGVGKPPKRKKAFRP